MMQSYIRFFHVGCYPCPFSISARSTAIVNNTFKLFTCEDGLPTFAYTYEEAVNNHPPYLCTFQVMKIQTKFQMEGISKRTISLEDQKKLILEGKDRLLDAWWISLFPGLAVAITVVALQQLGDGLIESPGRNAQPSDAKQGRP